MSGQVKPVAVADEALEAVLGGGVFVMPSGGWGADGLVMGKGPLPGVVANTGEPAVRYMDFTTEDHR